MTKPLRIATIGHSYVIDSNRAELDRLARVDGIDVTVLAPEFFHGDLRSVTLEPAEGKAYQLLPLRAFLTREVHTFFYGGLKSALARGSFDLLYVWEEPYVVAGFQAARAAYSLGLPFIFRTDQNLSKTYPPPFGFFERYCVRHAAAWIATGRLVAEAMCARGYPPSTMELLPHGVDEERFRPDGVARAATRKELGLTGVVVGFVGRLVEEKGLDVLMAALERLKDKPDWQLLILGVGPYRQKIAAWATAQNVADRVRFGFAKHGDVPRFLQAMDVLVAPSQTTPVWKEQLGRMIIEAFACRVAVIGSDSGEIPHVIGDAGLVVPERDVEAWAKAIGSLVADEGRRLAVANAGYARCLKSFTAQSVADKYEEFFRGVIAVRGRNSRSHIQKNQAQADGGRPATKGSS